MLRNFQKDAFYKSGSRTLLNWTKSFLSGCPHCPGPKKKMSTKFHIYIYDSKRCWHSHGVFHRNFKRITKFIIMLDRRSRDHEVAGREFRGARCSTMMLCRKSTAICNLIRPCSILTATSVYITTTDCC